MAKGSVRKKGKKWYYRFYVEDASGRLVQKEYAGTESKSETEKMLRQAMDDYDSKKFVARTDRFFSERYGRALPSYGKDDQASSDQQQETFYDHLRASAEVHGSADLWRQGRRFQFAWRVLS